MKTKKLYILRHGETEFNRKGMVQGSGIDAPLNETGRRQAAAFYEAYKDVAFDKIYISNLQRTQQTIQSFIEDGISHQVLPELREISWGTQEGVVFTPESENSYQHMIRAWIAGNLDEKVENGESPNEVAVRQKVAMNVILSREEEGTVLICMHGRAMRILLAWTLGYPLSEMERFPHTNCGLYVLHYNGSFNLEVFNDISHLQKVMMSD